MLEIQNKTIHISYHAIRQNINDNYIKHIKMSSDHKLDLLKKTPQDIIQDIKLNTFKSKLTKELTSKNMIFLSGFFWVKNKTLASYHHHHHHQYFLFLIFFFLNNYTQSTSTVISGRKPWRNSYVRQRGISTGIKWSRVGRENWARGQTEMLLVLKANQRWNPSIVVGRAKPTSPKAREATADAVSTWRVLDACYFPCTAGRF